MNKTMLLPLFLVACGGAPVEFSAELTAVDAGAEATVMVGAGGSGQDGRVGVGGAALDAAAGGRVAVDAQAWDGSYGPTPWPLACGPEERCRLGASGNTTDFLLWQRSLGCETSAECCRGLECRSNGVDMPKLCLPIKPCETPADCPCGQICGDFGTSMNCTASATDKPCSEAGCWP